MEIQAESADRKLLLELSGELDHHGARNALREVELAIDAALPRVLVLDFSGITFMDSSGIGLILGRIRLVKLWNGRVTISNITENVAKMAKLAGVFTFANIDRTV